MPGPGTLDRLYPEHPRCCECRRQEGHLIPIMTTMKTLQIKPPAHQASSYPVIIGKDLLKKIPELTKGADRIAIVHDVRMKELAQTVSGLLENASMIAIAS